MHILVYRKYQRLFTNPIFKHYLQCHIQPFNEIIRLTLNAVIDQKPLIFLGNIILKLSIVITKKFTILLYTNNRFNFEYAVLILFQTASFQCRKILYK